MPNKLKVFSILIFSLITFLLASPVFSTIIRVPQDQSTIQAAINVTSNHDTVLVEPGTYNENINFNGKSLLLQSTVGAEVTTIRPSNPLSPIIQVVSGEDSLTTISGFTITGARRGGIYIRDSNCRIIKNIFDSDSTIPYGGAIECGGAPHGERVEITENVFQNNGGQGSAIFASRITVQIYRNLMIDNSSPTVWIDGAQGIYSYLINNTVYHSSGTVINLSGGGGVSLANNIFYNTGISNTDISTSTAYNDFFPDRYFVPGEGNISVDPLFRAGVPFDYHLRRGSLCIDSGSPGSPVPPGGGTRVDIGAFEYIPLRGDLDDDKMFTPADVVMELNCVFLASGDCSLELADMNCDGQLTPADVVLILNLVFLGILPSC